MSNYVFCECRTWHSHDLSVPPGQPFHVNVEYDNSSGARAWVHLNVSNFGDLTPIGVPPGAGIVTFSLPYFPGDTTGVIIRARLRSTDEVSDPEFTLFAEEEQTDIAFYGLGMGVVPELKVAAESFITPLGKFYSRRFPPKFDNPFPALVRILIQGKPLGRSPVLRYDLPGIGTAWTQIRGKWGLEYIVVTPNPVVLGNGERPLATAILLDLSGKVMDQTHFDL